MSLALTPAYPASVNSTGPVFTIGEDFLSAWKLYRRKDSIQSRCRLNSSECVKAKLLLQNWPNMDFDTNIWIASYFNSSIDIRNHSSDCDTNWLNSSSNCSSSPLPKTLGTPQILPTFELWQTILIALCISLCILLTVAGNILVLLAFIVDRTIRQPSNYFIASLAATDILIGSISMPFYTVYILMGYWNLGPLSCDLWLSVDYTVCLVSQYTVLLITIDRYCSVKIAAKYRSWRTKDKVISMLIITWIIPALLFFISIFGWEHFIGYRDLLPGECTVQFLKDPVFNTALIIGYYWTTLVVLFILYGGIYKTAYNMQKKSEAKQRRVAMVQLCSTNMAAVATPTKPKLHFNSVSGPVHTETARTNSLSVDPGPQGAGVNVKTCVDVTSSTGVKNENDRSSSPVFDSDDDCTSLSKVISCVIPKIMPPPLVCRRSLLAMPLPKIVEHGTPSSSQQGGSNIPGSNQANSPLSTFPGRDVRDPSVNMTDASASDPQRMALPSPIHEFPGVIPPPSEFDTPESLPKCSPGPLCVIPGVGQDSGPETGPGSSLTAKVDNNNFKPVDTEVSVRGDEGSTSLGVQCQVVQQNDPTGGSKVEGCGRGRGKKSIMHNFRQHKRKTVKARVKSKSENRARKALRTISFILGAFVACWTPYHVLALVEGFCSSPPCTNHHLFMFSYFLCYANSPINPFCYALANKQFKKTFFRILRGDLHLT